MNLKFERFVINYYADLPRLLKEIDVEIQHNGLMLCPMHDNYNTPAAKIFKDENGWVFWCFAEGRMYSAYDIYKDICKCNMKLMFRNLWNSLSESQQELMKDRFGDYDEGVEIQGEVSFIKFSKKQISYKQLINELQDALKA